MSVSRHTCKKRIRPEVAEVAGVAGQSGVGVAEISKSCYKLFVCGYVRERVGKCFSLLSPQLFSSAGLIDMFMSSATLSCCYRGRKRVR